MDDRTTFRKKFALRLAGHPVTVLPVLGGLTAIGAAWAFGLSGDLMFGGIAGIVIGVAALVTRAKFFGEQIARKLHEELQERDHQSTEAALDAFRERLARDEDTRDERLLDQLRELVVAFKRNTTWASRVNSVSAAEIAGGVEELFRTCVRKLEDRLSILGEAKRLTVRAARKALDTQAEQMLREVEASVSELADLLTSVYTLGSGTDQRGETTRVREQLQRSLEIARRVDEEMNPQAAIRARLRARTKDNPS